jgi:hypothetical protein
MDATLASIPHRIIFANARRLQSRASKREPNWVFAKYLFGLGSTYATALCRRIGVNPDGYTVDPLPQKQKGSSE